MDLNVYEALQVVPNAALLAAARTHASLINEDMSFNCSALKNPVMWARYLLRTLYTDSYRQLRVIHKYGDGNNAEPLSSTIVSKDNSTKAMEWYQEQW